MRLRCCGIRAKVFPAHLGQLLLENAISRARAAVQSVGSAGLFVDAKNEDAARFYQRYGSASKPLFLHW